VHTIISIPRRDTSHCWYLRLHKEWVQTHRRTLTAVAHACSTPTTRLTHAHTQCMPCTCMEPKKSSQLLSPRADIGQLISSTDLLTYTPFSTADTIKTYWIVLDTQCAFTTIFCVWLSFANNVTYRTFLHLSKLHTSHIYLPDGCSGPYRTLSAVICSFHILVFEFCHDQF
jgi:hypothetical protein